MHGTGTPAGITSPGAEEKRHAGPSHLLSRLARSSDVNANFTALAEAITGLQARVDALDGGGTLPISGTYTVLGQQTGLMPFGPQGVVEAIIYSGSLTLGPGETSGSASMSIRELKHDLNIGPSGSSRTFSDSTETIQGSWSTSNGGAGVTLSIPNDNSQVRPLRFARAGLRLYIGNSINPADGSSVLLFLIRR